MPTLSAYLLAPPWAKQADRALLTVQYTSLALLGLFALNGVMPGNFASLLFGGVLLVGALSSLFGVMTRLYRWEWVALWPMVASLLGFIVLFVQDHRWTAVTLLFGLIAPLLHRWVRLHVLANTLRKAQVAAPLGG